jgi:hypothetical protein
VPVARLEDETLQDETLRWAVEALRNAENEANEATLPAGAMGALLY